MISALKFIGRNFISIALVILALIVGGYIVGTANEVRDLFFPQTDAEIKTFVLSVNEIQAIAELVTVSGKVSTVDVPVEINRGFLNAGYYKANHIAIGAIDAGIKFDAIQADDISYENGTYSITLPAPIITSCRIEYIDQNQHSFTLLPADWDMVRQIAKAEALEQFAKGMIEEGILERAAEEAEIRIGDFVTNLTDNPANIEFKDGSNELVLPDSCKPFAPTGWEKDADGGWRQTS